MYWHPCVVINDGCTDTSQGCIKAAAVLCHSFTFLLWNLFVTLLMKDNKKQYCLSNQHVTNKHIHCCVRNGIFSTVLSVVGWFIMRTFDLLDYLSAILFIRYFASNKVEWGFEKGKIWGSTMWVFHQVVCDFWRKRARKKCLHPLKRLAPTNNIECSGWMHY